MWYKRSNSLRSLFFYRKQNTLKMTLISYATTWPKIRSKNIKAVLHNARERKRLCPLPPEYTPDDITDGALCNRNWFNIRIFCMFAYFWLTQYVLSVWGSSITLALVSGDFSFSLESDRPKLIFLLIWLASWNTEIEARKPPSCQSW